MAITVHKQPSVLSAVGNPMALQASLSAGTYCELIVQGEDLYYSDIFENLGDPVRAYPDADSKCLWDIRSLLESIVGQDPPTQVTAPDLVVCQNMCKRYQLIIHEYDSDDVKVSTKNITGLFVANAQFPIRHGQRLRLHSIQRKWLTFQPYGKRVSDYQPEFLYIFIQDNPTVPSCDLEVAVTYIDDTTATLRPYTAISVRGHDIVRVATGYRQLGLHNEAKLVKSWHCTLKYNTVSISQPFLYEIAPDCSPLDRYFLFKNFLGGYDTLRAAGEASTQFSTASNTYALIPGPLDSPASRRVFDQDTIGDHTVEQATGFLNGDEKRWLRELLASEDVYRIGGDIGPNLNAGNAAMVPINIKRTGSDIVQDNNFTDGIRFEYVEKYF